MRVYSIYFCVIQNYFLFSPPPTPGRGEQSRKGSVETLMTTECRGKCILPTMASWWHFRSLLRLPVQLKFKKGHLPSPQSLTHLRNGLHQRGLLGIVSYLWGKGWPSNYGVESTDTKHLFTWRCIAVITEHCLFTAVSSCLALPSRGEDTFQHN